MIYILHDHSKERWACKSNHQWDKQNSFRNETGQTLVTGTFSWFELEKSLKTSGITKKEQKLGSHEYRLHDLTVLNKTMLITFEESVITFSY